MLESGTGRDDRAGCPAGRSRVTSGSLCLAALVLAGCSSVQVRHPDGHSEYQSRDEFAAYVERVFRYHNRVVNDLIVASSLSGDLDLDEASPLVRAEDAMADACRPLNDTVSATIEGRELGLFQKLQMPSAVPACEAASRRVEALLPPPI